MHKFRSICCMSLSGLLAFFLGTAVVCGAEEEAVPYETKAAETLGATLVAYSMDAHVNVGLVEQAYNAETIDEERALALINLTVTMLDQIGPSVIALSKYAECGEEDKKCLVSLAKGFKAIKAEAVALRAYIESGEDADFAEFESKQQAAQNLMDNLLE
jgi:hypothetical protein